MSAVARHLHVKLTEADGAILDALRGHYHQDTDSQLVRMLLRQEARRVGLGASKADTMPRRGRPKKTKEK